KGPASHSRHADQESDPEAGDRVQRLDGSEDTHTLPSRPFLGAAVRRWYRRLGVAERLLPMQLGARSGLAPNACLGEHAQKFEQDCCGRHARHAAGIEWRRNLDDIGADKIEAAQFAYEALHFQCGESAGLWRPSSRRVSRIEQVDVERDIGRTLADDLSSLLCGPPPALVIKFLDRNHTHSTVMA